MKFLNLNQSGNETNALCPNWVQPAPDPCVCYSNTCIGKPKPCNYSPCGHGGCPKVDVKL